MAIAIRHRREVRGAEAVAERPDGSRIRFVPYPTPLYDAGGAFIGAVNLLVDVTHRHRAAELRREADRCRRLCNSIGDPLTVEALDTMAAEYDAEADRLERLN
jgi:hypothetical protein